MNKTASIAVVSVLLASPVQALAQFGVHISRPTPREAVPADGTSVTLPFTATLFPSGMFVPCGQAPTHTWTRDNSAAQACSGFGCSVPYYESAATRGVHVARLNIDYHFAMVVNGTVSACIPANVQTSRTYVIQYPPTVQIGSAPGRLRAGQAGTFSATGTLDEDYAASDNLALSWTFGDGYTANGATVTHAWAKCGDYPVTVTASDGGLTTAQTTWIYVTSYNCTVKQQ